MSDQTADLERVDEPGAESKSMLPMPLKDFIKVAKEQPEGTTLEEFIDMVNGKANNDKNE